MTFWILTILLFKNIAQQQSKKGSTVWIRRPLYTNVTPQKLQADLQQKY